MIDAKIEDLDKFFQEKDAELKIKYSKEGTYEIKNNLGADREDAVERLNALKQFIGYDKDSEIVKATQKSLDMAIKALKHPEKNVRVMLSATPQEPFINKPCVSEKQCEHDKNVILDKIKAEIDKARFIDKDTRIVKNALASGMEVAMQIIDKYKAESEEINGR